MTSVVDHGPWSGPFICLKYLGGQEKWPKHFPKTTRHFMGRQRDNCPSKCPWRCLGVWGCFRVMEGWGNYWKMYHRNHHGPWFPPWTVNMVVVLGTRLSSEELVSKNPFDLGDVWVILQSFSKRTNPLDTTILSWRRGFFKGIDFFLASHERDYSIQEAACESAKVPLRAIVPYQANTSRTKAQTDKAIK